MPFFLLIELVPASCQKLWGNAVLIILSHKQNSCIHHGLHWTLASASKHIYQSLFWQNQTSASWKWIWKETASYLVRDKKKKVVQKGRDRTNHDPMYKALITSVFILDFFSFCCSSNFEDKSRYCNISGRKTQGLDIFVMWNQQKKSVNSYFRQATGGRFFSFLSQKLLLVEPVADVKASCVIQVGSTWWKHTKQNRRSFEIVLLSMLPTHWTVQTKMIHTLWNAVEYVSQQEINWLLFLSTL